MEIGDLPQPRGIGKTTVLNEIGFIYQALGYDVLVWTPFNNEHVGCRLIRECRDVRGLRFNDKTICLVDEVDLHPLNDTNMEIKDYLNTHNVTMVGFYNWITPEWW